MEYRIVLSPRADRELRKLTRSIQEKIDRALFKLKINPFVVKKKFLKDIRLADFRIRMGDYRILYDIYDEHKTVYILRIGHRKDIYK